MKKKYLYFLIIGTILFSLPSLGSDSKSTSKVTLNIYPNVTIASIEDISLKYDEENNSWEISQTTAFQIFSTVTNYNITAIGQNTEDGVFRVSDGEGNFISYIIEWTDDTNTTTLVGLTSEETELGNAKNSSLRSSSGEIKVKLLEEGLDGKPNGTYKDILTIIISGI